MTDDRSTLLSSADLAQLGDLMFVARRMVEGLYAGRHRSPRRGHSTEFYDYRQYLPGDEPKRVDWKLFGRTDRLYLKRFRHESDLNVYLLIDRSASMDFAGLGPSGKALTGKDNVNKWTYARQLAAAIAYLLVRQQDRVGLMFFDDGCEPIMPSGGGPEHLRKLIGALEQAQPTRHTDPVTAMARAHGAIAARQSRRGMVVTISDMLEPAGQWCSAMAPFAHDRFDMVSLQVLHPQELDLRGIGGLRLVDKESWQSLRLTGQRIGPAYAQRMRQHIERLGSGLGRLGADHQLLLTTTSPIRALSQFVANRADHVTSAGR